MASAEWRGGFDAGSRNPCWRFGLVCPGVSRHASLPIVWRLAIWRGVLAGRVAMSCLGMPELHTLPSALAAAKCTGGDLWRAASDAELEVAVALYQYQTNHGSHG